MHKTGNDARRLASLLTKGIENAIAERRFYGPGREFESAYVEKKVELIESQKAFDESRFHRELDLAITELFGDEGNRK